MPSIHGTHLFIILLLNLLLSFGSSFIFCWFEKIFIDSTIFIDVKEEVFKLLDAILGEGGFLRAHSFTIREQVALGPRTGEVDKLIIHIINQHMVNHIALIDMLGNPFWKALFQYSRVVHLTKLAPNEGLGSVYSFVN